MMTLKKLSEDLEISGLPRTEARIYACIILSGTVGASEIGRTLEMTGQNVSMAVQGLIEKNLVVKIGRKYTLGNPSAFSEFLKRNINDTIEKVEIQKNKGINIGSMINEAYMQSTGKPVIQMLNYDQWQDFKKEILAQGKEKIIYLIRGKRKTHFDKNTSKMRNLSHSEIFKNGIKYQIITPFLDKFKDTSNQDLDYFSLESKLFNNFNIDITIKDDYVAINRRQQDNKDFEIITIQSKEIAESFKELFQFLKEKNMN